MTLSLISDSVAVGSLPARVVDNYLSGLTQASPDVINGLFAWSADNVASWPNQDQPLNAEVLKNLAGQSDGNWLVSSNFSSGALIWDDTEKSIHFDNVKWTAGAQCPASFLQAQFAGASLQHWLMGGYFKLPSAAQWPTTQGSVHSLMGDQNSNANPILGSIRMTRQTGTAPGERRLSLVFGQSGATTAGASIIEPTDFMGKWCFMGIYRTAAARGYYIEALDGSVDPISSVLSAGVGSVNTDTFSRPVCWGLDAAQASGAGTYYHRVARGFLENLEATGRDPLEIIAADIARIKARGRIG